MRKNNLHFHIPRVILLRLDAVGRLDEGQPGFAGVLVEEQVDVVEYLRMFHHAWLFNDGTRDLFRPPSVTSTLGD